MLLKTSLATWLLLVAAAAARGADPGVTFLQGDAARKEIINDAADPYFSRMVTAEMEMKSGQPLPPLALDAQRAAQRSRYQAAVVDFTAEEQQLIQAAAEKASSLTLDYPLFHDLPWSFLKTNGTIEAGMPYTIAGSIVLSQSILKSLGGADKALAASRLARLLIHEQSHVLQRKYPQVMADLYTSLWHFVKIAPPTFDPALAAQHVFNPDGTDVSWAYPVGKPEDNTFFLPLILAQKPSPDAAWVMMRDMKFMAIPLTRTGQTFMPQTDADHKTKVVALATYTDYVKQFPVGGDNYHPNEIAADVFAIIATTPDNLPARWQPERTWFKTHLQSAPPAPPPAPPSAKP